MLLRRLSGSADRSMVPTASDTGLNPTSSPERTREPGRTRPRQIADSGCTGPPSNTTAGSLGSKMLQLAAGLPISAIS